MSHYNPYTATLSAAYAELTSDGAKQYYALRARADTQMVIDATLAAGIAVYEAAVLAYQMGAFVRAWIEATEQAASTRSLSAAEGPLSNHAIEITAIVPATSCAIAVCAPQAQINEAWILAAIKNESLKPWDAIAPLTYALIAEAEKKTTKTRKPRSVSGAELKTETTAKKAPRARKPASATLSTSASPAPRKNPTRATVGGYSASID
jgi:hypothetical protein